jgi:hypothetical protein
MSKTPVEALQDLIALREGELKADVGSRWNEGKTMMCTVVPQFTREMAAVLTYGATKYDRSDWMKGMSFTETLECAKRHIDAWETGKLLDTGPKGSGLAHLAHAAVNLMFLYFYTTYYNPTTGEPYPDDRTFANLKEIDETPSTV